MMSKTGRTQRDVFHRSNPRTSGSSDPRFRLGVKLTGLIKLNRLPLIFLSFKRLTMETVGLTEPEIKRTVRSFLEPENIGLAVNIVQSLKDMGGSELTIKFLKTPEHLTVEFKAKGLSRFIDSASLNLLPLPKQETLC